MRMKRRGTPGGSGLRASRGRRRTKKREGENKMSHSVLRGVVIGALIAGSVFVPGCRKAAAKRPEKTVRVTLGSLKRQKFQESIPIKGTVYPVEYATVSARSEGTLDDLKVDEGDRVKRGSLLFSIDRTKQENEVKVKTEEVAVARTELATAEIELKLARTREEKAKQDYDRAEKLNQSKAIAATNYESDVVAWKAATAEVQKSEVSVQYRKAKVVQAETNLLIAQKNLKDAMVTAPFDCLIAEKLVEQGEYVKPGEKLLKLENDSRREIIAYLSAVYHRKVIPGKTLAFISIDGKPFGSAPVSYRAETIDPSTRTFKIKVLLPAERRLACGLLCDLRLVLAEEEGSGVPSSAVLQRGNRFFVFIADSENRAKSVTVKRGIVDGDNCQLIDPEALEKARIIVAGQYFVNDGDRLSIAK